MVKSGAALCARFVRDVIIASNFLSVNSGVLLVAILFISVIKSVLIIESMELDCTKRTSRNSVAISICRGVKTPQP